MQIGLLMYCQTNKNSVSFFVFFPSWGVGVLLVLGGGCRLKQFLKVSFVLKCGKLH